MKNAIILAVIAAAVVGVIMLKRSEDSCGTSSCCPCSMAKEAVTNQTETGSSTVE